MTDKSPKKRATSKPAQSKGSGSSQSPVPKPYVVLARKYRPQTFEDLIGQNALVVTLKNAFEARRIAQAYMLTGVRGVGKTTTARILARALNFTRDGVANEPTTNLPRDPADYGDHCADIIESRHPDVIEMDAASNTGVDNIREIIESARYKPLMARYKVFIVDEVHMLSKGAFNALLKTLEEPPEHVKFIFATTEIRKVPVTVLSRCQRFDLRRVDVDELIEHFKSICESEQASAEYDALRLIARAAEGSVRDGLSILDQAIAFQQGDVREAGIRAMLGLANRGRIFDFLEHLLSGQCKSALDTMDALYKDGSEPTRILADLAEVVHLATKIKVAPANGPNDGFSAEDHRRAQSVAEKTSVPLLARAWQILLKGIDETQRAPNPRASAEMVVIRLAYTADLPAPDDIIKSLGTKDIVARSPKQKQPASVDAQGTASRNRADTQTEPSPLTTTPEISATPTQSGENVIAPPRTHPPYPTKTDAQYLSCFDDVLALVAQKRDARLKVHLEENTSLVRFDAKARAIDIFLLPQAPRTLANDLRERLNEWTGVNWIVVLSKEQGATPIAQVRRQNVELEIDRLKADPAIKAALDTFPDAKIVGVTPLAPPASDAAAESEISDDEPEAGTAQ